MGSCLIYFFAIFLCITGLLVLYIKWSLTFWERKRVPHLKPVFPFGNFGNPITTNISFSTCFSNLYLQMKEKGLGSGGIYVYTTPFVLIVDPMHVKEVLVKSFEHFHWRGFYSNEKHQPVSMNIATAEGWKWRSLRVKLTPTFTTAKMRFMCDLMVEAATSMEASFDEHATKKMTINAKDCGQYYATDIIMKCAIGVDCNSFEDNCFDKVITKVLRDSTGFAKLSFCMAFPKLAQLLRIPLFEYKGAEYLCNLLDQTMKRRRQGGHTRKDLLQILLELEENGIVDDTEIKAQCLLSVLAGHETTSVAVTFALFELAVNQDIQDRLRKEINEILSGYDEGPTYDALMNMKYLEMVACESLRKYPPIPFLNRMCVKDIILPDTDFTIEKNTNIFIPIMSLHRDPNYFPNPEKFDPERFSNNKIKIVPYTYIPFGEGPRRCLGDRFGKLGVKLAILAAVRKYKITLHPSVKLPLEFTSSLAITPAQDILLTIEKISEDKLWKFMRNSLDIPVGLNRGLQDELEYL